MGGGDEGGDREHWRGEVDGVGTGSLERINKIPTGFLSTNPRPPIQFDKSKYFSSVPDP